MALTNKLSAIGDAIREKTGKADKLSLDQMPLEIASIISGGGGGDTTQEDGLVTRTLTEYSNERVTTIGAYAFNMNTVIESVSFPNVTTFVGSNHFQGCSALRSIHFPKLENAQGGNAFKNCTALLEARFPNYSALSGSPSFSGCSALKLMDYGNLNSIASGAWSNCKVLETLIFRNSSKITALGNVNAFTGTPFASGGTGGTVYVPQALIESYQTATNWSTLYAAGTCNFVSIEGSEYE